MNKIAEQIKKEFIERYNHEPYLYFSPGRINLIGEHVDYNDGFVMPGAIDKGSYYAVALNNSDTINFYSVDFDESLSLHISEVKKMDNWKNYVLSVLNEFVLAGKEIKGFDCVLGGDIANGAGMSSSAAVEGGMAFSLNELCGYGFSRKELALLCQRAEHNYPNVKSGIMDQYANMFGKDDHVMILDCRSVTHEYLPLALGNYSIVLINTKVHHSLASSAYNQRRKECEEGLNILKEHLQITSFRDLKSTDELVKVKDKMSDEVYKRCLYVTGEILRTQKAAELLKAKDITSFGELMFETHEGLRDLYEVSCKELDFLVAHAKKDDAVAGSRLMGGGFGGCTINIIQNDHKENFLKEILASYKNEFDIDAEVFEVRPVAGTHEIKPA